MFEKKSYSIEGEDLILASIFNNENKGYYLDIGCNHPVQHSNTYLFYLAGWRGLCIDPNAKFKKEFESFRPEDNFISGAVSSNLGLTQLARIGFAYSIQFDYLWQP